MRNLRALYLITAMTAGLGIGAASAQSWPRPVRPRGEQLERRGEALEREAARDCRRGAYLERRGRPRAGEALEREANRDRRRAERLERRGERREHRAGRP